MQKEKLYVQAPTRFGHQRAFRELMPSGKEVLFIEWECARCGKTFCYEAKGTKRRGFCGGSCAAKTRMESPERKELSRKVALKYLAGSQKGIKNPATALRMRLNNPMMNLEAREKMRQKLIGKKFKERGGNGKLTTQQILLQSILKIPVEYPIKTAGVKHLFSGLPNSYKVDLAIPERKIAIEVDGKSHKLSSKKAQDKKKEDVLKALGWRVLRFWNEEVTMNTDTCIQKILSMI
jgi:hypothetical protein